MNVPWTPRTRLWRNSVVGLSFVLFFGGVEASAHGGAVPLADWGAFPSSAAYCQRVIAHAAARCTLRAAKARRECLDATVRGAMCDEAKTDAAVQTARREALDQIDRYCSENNAQTLGFIGTFDLQADVIRFCREWEDLTASAAYGPVLATQAPLDAGTLRCVTAVAIGVTKLGRLVFRTWRQALDRLAVRSFELPVKEKLVGFAAGRCATLEEKVAELLSGTCGSQRFQSLYSRTPTQFANDIQLRASCFAPAFYIQNETSCPASVCGNGILEPAEGCDDGNLDDGDGCSADCARE